MLKWGYWPLERPSHIRATSPRGTFDADASTQVIFLPLLLLLLLFLLRFRFLFLDVRFSFHLAFFVFLIVSTSIGSIYFGVGFVRYWYVTGIRHGVSTIGGR